MNNIAIIPARGSSKRLARKNILPLGGEPLLARVIKNCIASQLFSKVIVSTEDEEISIIAKNAGAFVHARPPELAKDRSTVVEVCQDVLQSIICDNFCCVYATAGLLSPSTLQESANLFLQTKENHTLMGVSNFNYSVVQALKVDAQGKATMLLPEFMKVQSQFYPKTRVSNGTFCWSNKEYFLKQLTFYSSNLKVFDVPDNEVCDLDTPEDYKKLINTYIRQQNNFF